MKKTEEIRTQSDLSGKPEDYHDIYDRIAKRCLSISEGCTVSLINGLFGTDYPADSRVRYNWTENVDDGLKKTLADTVITINDTHSYHCEFQMKAEGDMILRVFEYGFHHAMRSRAGFEVLDFPEPMVVYLYDEPMPEDYCVVIRFGKQGEFKYGRYSSEMPEVNKVMKDAMVLPGDKYVLRIMQLEKDAKTMQENVRATEEENAALKKQGEKKDEQLQEQAAQIAELKRQLAELQADAERVADDREES